jgi:hypothetical protein
MVLGYSMDTKGLFGWKTHFAKPKFGSDSLFGMFWVFATIIVEAPRNF